MRRLGRIQGQHPPAWARLPRDDRRWVGLFAAARIAAALIAAVLVAWNGVDAVAVAGLVYAAFSTAVLVASPRARSHPAAWALDGAAVLALVVSSNDWRSPFYLLWVTTLALPAAQLPRRHAAALACLAPLAFFVVAFLGGPSPGRFGPVSSETLAIHVSLPFFCVSAIAYAADVLRRLQSERSIRERLAIEAERRRIAWELHDSAKQRVHAAHLLVSSLLPRVPEELRLVVHRSVAELESAVSDMDTSLAELRSPLEGRLLHDALRARIAELDGSTSATIDLSGRAPELPPLIAAHAYRIGCEALTNALRHAQAERVSVQLGGDGGELRLDVVDDGVGLPDRRRPGATGLMAMESRAGTIGGRLEIAPGDDGRGTRVTLCAPTTTTPGGPS